MLQTEPHKNAWLELFDRRSQEECEMVAEFRVGAHVIQPWPLAPSARLKRIWDRFAETGCVHDEKGLLSIEDIFIRNALRLMINTELAGHSMHCPRALAIDDMELTESELEAFVDWAVDIPDGGYRISDYGIDKLLQAAALSIGTDDPIEKLVYLDMLLNVAHQRSDLASWFVEGGSMALDEIARPVHALT